MLALVWLNLEPASNKRRKVILTESVLSKTSQALSVSMQRGESGLKLRASTILSRRICGSRTAPGSCLVCVGVPVLVSFLGHIRRCPAGAFQQG